MNASASPRLIREDTDEACQAGGANVLIGNVSAAGESSIAEARLAQTALRLGLPVDGYFAKTLPGKPSCS